MQGLLRAVAGSEVQVQKAACTVEVCCKGRQAAGRKTCTMLALLQAPQALSDTLARGKALAAEKDAQSEGVTWLPVKVKYGRDLVLILVCFFIWVPVKVRGGGGLVFNSMC